MTCRSGFAPIGPFMTTIAKQRGYSAFVVGLMFTLQPILGLLMRPTMGAVTDKYKCRRSVFIASATLLFLLSCVLSIIPGTTSKEELDDSDVIKSPLFWLFFATISLIAGVGMVKTVLEDTVCMQLLGTCVQTDTVVPVLFLSVWFFRGDGGTLTISFVFLFFRFYFILYIKKKKN